MNAEIITIGDEILIGQIVDTNSAFIAQELNRIGISVYQITSVQDDQQHIQQALEEAGKRVSLVILTGGLGPTKDDITKQTFCSYFQDQLVLDQRVLSHVEELFARYVSTPISDVNRMQAMVPSKARVLFNRYGTAPGMWMQKDEVVYVSLPGVPYEMKGLMEHEVIPALRMHFQRPFILHRTLITYGLGESAIAERIEDIEAALPVQFKLAYLPHMGKVRLRLTAKGQDEQALAEEMHRQLSSLRERLSELVYGEEEGELMEVVVGKLLLEKGLSLAVAESCTGGKLAAAITSVPGASAYFKGGMVPYATVSKINLLGVLPETIETYSVVSEQVAAEMARGALNAFGADLGVGITGNAGPDKGDSQAEVGTVCMAIADNAGVSTYTFSMGNHRERVVVKSVNKALELLQKEILKK